MTAPEPPVMRAVFSQAEDHRIELRFHPPGLRLGVFISILASLILGLVFVLRCKHIARRRETLMQE